MRRALPAGVHLLRPSRRARRPRRGSLARRCCSAPGWPSACRGPRRAWLAWRSSARARPAARPRSLAIRSWASARGLLEPVDPRPGATTRAGPGQAGPRPGATVPDCASRSRASRRRAQDGPRRVRRASRLGREALLRLVLAVGADLAHAFEAESERGGHLVLVRRSDRRAMKCVGRLSDRRLRPRGSAAGDGGRGRFGENRARPTRPGHLGPARRRPAGRAARRRDRRRRPPWMPTVAQQQGRRRPGPGTASSGRCLRKPSIGALQVDGPCRRSGRCRAS